MNHGRTTWVFGEKCGITPGLYKMPDEPVGPKILIPGFESAVAVRGAFGWFSAGWIQRLAPGLAVYLARESVAPIDFTVSPQFFAAERAVVESSITSNAEAATQRIAHLFADGRIQATALGAHALDCMAWMIATSQLKLRIAVPTRESNYHPKIWLFDDGYHQVLARGSGNATGRGVGAGVEQLDATRDHRAHHLGIGGHGARHRPSGPVLRQTFPALGEEPLTQLVERDPADLMAAAELRHVLDLASQRRCGTTQCVWRFR